MAADIEPAPEALHLTMRAGGQDARRHPELRHGVLGEGIRRAPSVGRGGLLLGFDGVDAPHIRSLEGIRYAAAAAAACSPCFSPYVGALGGVAVLHTLGVSKPDFARVQSCLASVRWGPTCLLPVRAPGACHVPLT